MWWLCDNENQKYEWWIKDIVWESGEWSTLKPLYVQLPNFISQFWSSKGNHVMSIRQVDWKIKWGQKRLFRNFLVPWIFRVECRCSGLHWWQPHWLDTSRQTSHRRWKRWKLSIVGEFTSDFIWSADLCLKHLYCCSSSFSFPIMSQMTDFCQKLPLVHDFYGERKSRVVWICS